MYFVLEATFPKILPSEFDKSKGIQHLSYLDCELFKQTVQPVKEAQLIHKRYFILKCRIHSQWLRG